MRWIGVALAAMAWFGGPAAAQEVKLGGAYEGIDEATGLKLRLEPRETEGVASGYTGAFIGRDGAESEFEAFLSGAGGHEAETRVEIDGASVFMRFSPRPIGLIAVWIPVNEEGKLVLEKTRSYPFVRAGVDLPNIPDNLAAPPRAGAPGSVDPLLFLISYEFWRPNEVGDGYAALEEKWRGLLRLYAEVHTDVLWKLCQSRRTPPGLTEALEGQNVTCKDVLAKMASIQANDRFDKYKTTLKTRKAELIQAVKCARGQDPRSKCIESNQKTKEAALSLDSAKTVLERY